MRKYIRADLYRLYRRVPRLIILAVAIFLVGDTFWPSADSENTILDIIEGIEIMLKYAPPVIGIIEMFYVFSDDFAGKTAQIAIGIGVKRRQVILAKWLDMVIVSTVDLAVITSLATVLAAIDAKGITGALLLRIASHAFIAAISIAAYISLVLPIMFAMQSITIALLVYGVLSFGLLYKLINLITQFEKMQRFNLGKYTLTNAVNVFRSRMILGTFHTVSVIEIAVYMVIGIVVTYFIYRKKELEF